MISRRQFMKISVGTVGAIDLAWRVLPLTLLSWTGTRWFQFAAEMKGL